MNVIHVKFLRFCLVVTAFTPKHRHSFSLYCHFNIFLVQTREFVKQSGASKIGDHLPHSHDFHSIKGDEVRINYKPITLTKALTVGTS